MRFVPTEVAGVYVLEVERRQDARGFFGRLWCAEELARHGLSGHVAQVNVAYNRRRGTLRGLHYQLAPYAEAKLVRCTRGALFDVAVDVRPESPTYLRWVGVELAADTYRMLYVPEGCAHGYLTLEDHTEVIYLVSCPYTPSHERGIRYDDPAVGVRWPLDPVVVSEKDQGWPPYAMTRLAEGG